MCASINLCIGIPIALLYYLADPDLLTNFQGVTINYIKIFENRFFNLQTFYSLHSSLWLLTNGDIYGAISTLVIKLLPIPIFITYCAAPEMMQLNGIVVNDGFFADGSFIEGNYYKLEETEHKVYSPSITEDLEETEKFVKALADHRARRAVRVKAEYFEGFRNSEHWAYIIPTVIDCELGWILLSIHLFLIALTNR